MEHPDVITNKLAMLATLYRLYDITSIFTTTNACYPGYGNAMIQRTPVAWTLHKTLLLQN